MTDAVYPPTSGRRKAITFTSTPAGGTWTVPIGVTLIWATLVGAGGGGGGGGGGTGGGTGTYAGGGGAGSGHHILRMPIAVTPGQVLPITIGAAGTGGAYGTNAAGSNGVAGGNTQVGSLVALGGGAGQGGSPSDGTGGTPGGASLDDHAVWAWQGATGGTGYDSTGTATNGGSSPIFRETSTVGAQYGGGGACSYWGAGGAAGVSGGSGNGATGGNAASTSYGAGGGGGGAGGATGGNHGGTGGTGANGWAMVEYDA